MGLYRSIVFCQYFSESGAKIQVKKEEKPIGAALKLFFGRLREYGRETQNGIPDRRP
jgi:hypothetical protein